MRIRYEKNITKIFAAKIHSILVCKNIINFIADYRRAFYSTYSDGRIY